MLKDISPIGKLVLTVVLMFVCFFVLFGIASIVIIAFFGANPFTDPTIMMLRQDGSNLDIIKILTAAQSLGLFVLPGILAAYFFSKKPGDFLMTNYLAKSRTLLLTVFIALIFMPIMSFLGEVNMLLELPEFLEKIQSWMQESEDNIMELTMALVKAENLAVLIVNVIIIGVIPAVGEEFLFRGVIQKIFHLWTKNHHIAIFITAFLFSAFHFQFMTFLPRFVLGGFLGYLLIWTKSLWVPVLAHLINNSTAVIFAYFQPESLNPQQVGEGMYSWQNLLGAFAIGSFVIVFLSFQIIKIEKTGLKS